MIKVCISLIHNNNSERYLYIKSRLIDMQSYLSANQFEVNLSEVSHQPEIESHSNLFLLLRMVIYQIVDRNWCKYRQIKSFFPLRHIYNLTRNIPLSKNSRDRKRRSSAIEMIVTDKHIRAWAQFLETDSKYLICFEDDAIFKDDSNSSLRNLFTLIEENKEQFLYVDLAGGCNFEALRVKKFQYKQDENFRYFSKPVTNTACVYLMNRQLVAYFYKTLLNNLWIRMVGIDWMMNQILTTIKFDTFTSKCLHAYPPIFLHGSTTGNYLPWKR